MSLEELYFIQGAIIFVDIFVLLVEVASIGWKNSGLRRILLLETNSAATDVFYFCLRVSGLVSVFALIFSFGSVFYISNFIGAKLNYRLLASMDSYILQFLIVALANTFAFYCVHRLMHSRAFFDIHKVHHSALELNVITPMRNHPIDYMISMVINSVPAAILGADPLVVGAYLLANGIYQCLVHSNVAFMEGKLLKLIFITPLAHKLHHSNSSQHFDKNYGSLALWDYIFGTYYYPKPGENIVLGVEDEEIVNDPNPLKGMFAIIKLWLQFSSFRKADSRQSV